MDKKTHWGPAVGEGLSAKPFPLLHAGDRGLAPLESLLDRVTASGDRSPFPIKSSVDNYRQKA
jgi:hypothetical protein